LKVHFLALSQVNVPELEGRRGKLNFRKAKSRFQDDVARRTVSNLQRKPKHMLSKPHLLLCDELKLKSDGFALEKLVHFVRIYGKACTRKKLLIKLPA
jgi:hypothetical protein